MKHEVWGSGVRWDWDPGDPGSRAARARATATSSARCRIPQAPLDAPFTFAVIGDFGTGIKKPSTQTRRQLEVAQALERAVDAYDVRLVLTTGDNIYASKRFLPVDG